MSITPKTATKIIKFFFMMFCFLINKRVVKFNFISFTHKRKICCKYKFKNYLKAIVRWIIY